MSDLKTKNLPLFTVGDALLVAVGILLVFFLFYPSPLGIPRHVFALTWSSIFLEALSFMLIGSIVSGVVEAFVPSGIIERLVLGNRFAVVAGSASMGMFFPVCECAIVPVARRLLKKGVPLSAGIAFMLAVPIVNPVVIWSTAVAYQGDWSVVLTRVLLGFGIATTAAMIMGRAFSDQNALLPGVLPAKKEKACSHNHDHKHEHAHDHNHDHVHEHQHEDKHEHVHEHSHDHHHHHDHGQDHHHHDHHHDHGHEHGPGCSHTHHPTHSKPSKTGMFGARVISSLQHARDDFFDVAPYLVVGTLIAAIIRSSIPTSVIEQLAQSPVLETGSMMFLAFALNLCSEADAFIAASFTGIITLTGQMAFMVLGPMLDIKLLLMYRTVFSSKFIVALASVVVVLVFTVMMVMQYINGVGGL